MTFIKEFKVSNLAGRGGVIHHVLDPSVNVFWGLNGSGKTTLLRILDAALDDSTLGLEMLPFDWAEVTFHSHNNKVDLVRSFNKNDSKRENNKRRQPEINWSILSDLDLSDPAIRSAMRRVDRAPWKTRVMGSAKGDRRIGEMAYQHSYLPISRVNQSVAQRGEDPMSPDEQFAQQVNAIWTRYSSRSLAEIRDVQQRGLAEVLAILFGGTLFSDLEDAGDIRPTGADEAFELVERFLRSQNLDLPLGRSDFEHRYNSPDYRHVVAKIRSVMNQVDLILLPQKELQSVVEEMFIGEKRLQLRSPSPRIDRLGVVVQDKTLPVSALSSGEKQLLHILLETLAIEYSTIMIDEPELSLHVDWQLKLVESMRRVNQRGQFILATHSPDLMVNIDPGCVFEL